MRGTLNLTQPYSITSNEVTGWKAERRVEHLNPTVATTVTACRLCFFKLIAMLNFTTKMAAITEHVYRCMEEIFSIISHLPNSTLSAQGYFSWPLIFIILRYEIAVL